MACSDAEGEIERDPGVPNCLEPTRDTGDHIYRRLTLPRPANRSNDVLGRIELGAPDLVASD